MVTLRCNNCRYYEDGFCSKMGELVHNPLAKLFFGGARELFSQIEHLLGECGVDKKELTNNLTMKVIDTEDTIDILRQPTDK